MIDKRIMLFCFQEEFSKKRIEENYRKESFCLVLLKNSMIQSKEERKK